MRINRCGIIDYPEGQIYSIDLHPSGKFIATCGHDGKGNGLVTIWSTSCFGNSANEQLAEDMSAFRNEDSIPASLSSLPSQFTISQEDIAKNKIAERKLFNNAQNCVRWSKFNKGKYLVATGDTQVFNLYEPFIRSDGKPTLDNFLSLNGHTMEVLHADFSREGKYLASCSLDHTVIIWNMDDLPRKSIVLDTRRGGHTDFVTGLAFDPAEKFLATQSYDLTLKIWKCETWECERTIKGFFNSGSRSSLYTRLDWSSDGAFLITTSASNTGFQTAKVIIRKGFNYDRDLVGFNALVSCVRSNDNCISYEDPKHGKMTVNLIAVGSLDRSLSIWILPGINRPLCVIKNFFPEGILDLSWHQNVLAAIGINGSVRCILFDENELGEYFEGNDMCAHFDSLYGTIPSSYKGFMGKLTVEASNNWVDEVLKDVFVPRAELIKQSYRNHPCLGYHELTPLCKSCKQSYCKKNFKTTELEPFVEDLCIELRRIAGSDDKQQNSSDSDSD